MVCIELCSTRTMGNSARSGMAGVRRACVGGNAVVAAVVLLVDDGGAGLGWGAGPRRGGVRGRYPLASATGGRACGSAVQCRRVGSGRTEEMPASLQSLRMHVGASASAADDVEMLCRYGETSGYVGVQCGAGGRLYVCVYYVCTSAASHRCAEVGVDRYKGRAKAKLRCAAQTGMGRSDRRHGRSDLDAHPCTSSSP
jgi:hypothetical protein